MVQYDYSLNKETGVFEVKETGKVDLTEIINSNKENCGLNLAMLNISRGVSPEVYVDDGKHGGDFTGTLNINEAYQQKLNADQVTASILKAFGIDNLQDPENIEKVIRDAIAAKAQAEPKKEGE